MLLRGADYTLRILFNISMHTNSEKVAKQMFLSFELNVIFFANRKTKIFQV